MLNISESNISKFIKLEDFEVNQILRITRIRRLPLILVLSLSVGILIVMFLPWTQNITASGYVTTLYPEERPQAIQSVIAGRLDEWFVKEGDFVAAGDTIAYISEVKSEYFDPNLIQRTQDQILAKNQGLFSYDEKIKALETQFTILEEAMALKISQTQNKIEQAKNKISIDSIDLQAYENNFEIARNQLERITELHQKGLKSLSELQEKQFKLQESQAKVNVQKNKLINQQNELANLQLELLTVQKDYTEKLAKATSDKQSAISAKFESVAQVSKMENQLENYQQRSKFYYITAPQSGYITKTIKKGIGESIKEGEDIATIVPSEYNLAIEIYLRPQNIPLLDIDGEASIRFDGWPAVVLRGWPEASTGIFRGKVIAIDRDLGANGYYRVLVTPHDQERAWPEELRLGTGANVFILLNKVPVWYEIWRQLNGFPPDYYSAQEKSKIKLKRKAPIKSVK